MYDISFPCVCCYAPWLILKRVPKQTVAAQDTQIHTINLGGRSFSSTLNGLPCVLWKRHISSWFIWWHWYHHLSLLYKLYVIRICVRTCRVYLFPPLCAGSVRWKHRTVTPSVLYTVVVISENLRRSIKIILGDEYNAFLLKIITHFDISIQEKYTLNLHPSHLVHVTSRVGVNTQS